MNKQHIRQQLQYAHIFYIDGMLYIEPKEGPFQSVPNPKYELLIDFISLRIKLIKHSI